jgi:hypothetical protein
VFTWPHAPQVMVDRTRSERWGRRRIHIFLSAIPFLGSQLVMWASLTPGLSPSKAMTVFMVGYTARAVAGQWARQPRTRGAARAIVPSD